VIRLIPVVEGMGEVRAVPALIYRWLGMNGLSGEVVVPGAVNAKGCGNLKAQHSPAQQRGVEHYVGSALRGRPDAILVVLDADDECITRPPARKKLGPELLDRARAVAGTVPVGVVVANREFEAWILADLYDVDDAETRAGCKAAVGRLINESYEPAVHQVQLARRLAFSDAGRARSRSLDKLVRELARLVEEARARRET
jgi:hypothetical protein